MYAYMYEWHGDILREEPGVLKRASKDKKWQFLIHLQIINIWPSVKSFGHPKINGTGNVTQISAAVFKPLLSVLSWTVRWCPWPARAPDVRLSVWRWTYGILTRFVSYGFIRPWLYFHNLYDIKLTQEVTTGWWSGIIPETDYPTI